MAIFINFIPILLFIAIFFGSGVYFSIQGLDNAFYLVPPTAAIIPSLVIAWLMNRSPAPQTMKRFLSGASHHDIMTMCIIFLLSGALSTVTKSMGSVESTVNFALAIIPGHLLLVGVFITSALISTAIGSALGTIAAMAVIVTELAGKGAFSVEIGAATLLGGAMFGDNMSIISDTTIAAVTSQEANFKEKLKLNAVVAVIASALTIPLLLSHNSSEVEVLDKSFSLILISPYIVLILLAISGLNVFIVLVVSLAYAGVIGIGFSDYSVLLLAQDTSKGFAGMQEIMLLSILTGGLSGLANQNSRAIATKLLSLLPKNSGRRAGELVIALMVSIFDILLANNTIAIIFSGELAREIAKKCNIKPHESAAWLDIYSCVFQGIIPYGAQALLISAIAGVSPLLVVGKVYYCYILGIVTFVYILIRRQPKGK